jgi:putative transposase
MVHYRRNFLPGGTYFFTVALEDRSTDWLIRHADLLRLAFHKARAQRPFVVDAIVVLPEHMHCVWTLPPDDSDYPEKWRLIKATFSRFLHKAGGARLRTAKGELNVWQRRYWEHTIRDEADLEAHINYIHYNPVKHGLVKRVADWQHSSFHRFVRAGLIDSAWTSGADEGAASYGE